MNKENAEDHKMLGLSFFVKFHMGLLHPCCVRACVRACLHTRAVRACVACFGGSFWGDMGCCIVARGGEALGPPPLAGGLPRRGRPPGAAIRQFLREPDRPPNHFGQGAPPPPPPDSRSSPAPRSAKWTPGNSMSTPICM